MCFKLNNIKLINNNKIKINKKESYMGKIELDKYYTNEKLAEYVVNKTKEIIGEQNITEYLEPSAGGGVFLDYLDKPYLAYDIEPEDKLSRIIKQDYLILNLDYKKGRCIVGNPPYGNRNNLSRAFYKKSIIIGDYISFILPISQLDNVNSLYEFDLVHSEDLGIYQYSDRQVHCCLNIFKRPDNGLNKKNSNKLNDITIYRDDYKGLINGKNYNEMEFDICIFRRGSVGKIKTENINKQTYKIIINNKNLKDEIIHTILNYDWKNYKNHQSAPSISKEDIYNVLKEQIPQIS